MEENSFFQIKFLLTLINKCNQLISNNMLLIKNTLNESNI